MGGIYRQEGDYLLPNLAVPEFAPIGIWGQRHLRYIRAHRKAIYTSLLLGGKLCDVFAAMWRPLIRRLGVGSKKEETT